MCCLRESPFLGYGVVLVGTDEGSRLILLLVKLLAFGGANTLYRDLKFSLSFDSVAFKKCYLCSDKLRILTGILEFCLISLEFKIVKVCSV